MKTLVKILKVEDNTVHYAEICRKGGHVMIEDSMSIEDFNKALRLPTYGFELTGITTKKQAVKLLESFGLVVIDWDYCRVLHKYDMCIQIPHSYDNGYGYMVDQVGCTGYTHSGAVTEAIDCLFYHG